MIVTTSVPTGTATILTTDIDRGVAPQWVHEVHARHTERPTIMLDADDPESWQLPPLEVGPPVRPQIPTIVNMGIDAQRERKYSAMQHYTPIVTDDITSEYHIKNLPLPELCFLNGQVPIMITGSRSEHYVGMWKSPLKAYMTCWNLALPQWWGGELQKEHASAEDWLFTYMSCKPKQKWTKLLQTWLLAQKHFDFSMRGEVRIPPTVTLVGENVGKHLQIVSQEDMLTLMNIDCKAPFVMDWGMYGYLRLLRPVRWVYLSAQDNLTLSLGGKLLATITPRPSFPVTRLTAKADDFFKTATASTVTYTTASEPTYAR